MIRRPLPMLRYLHGFWSHGLKSLLIAVLCLMALPAFAPVGAMAQDAAACVDEYKQCRDACRVSARCLVECMNQRNACVTKAQSGGRPAGAAPAQPRAAPPSASGSAAVPASALPEGMRFGLRGRMAEDASNDGAPLSSQRERRVTQGIFRLGPRTPITPELRKEIEALDAAGMQTLICSYGPAPTDRKFFEGSFWAGRKPELSDALVAEASRGPNIDAALSACPPTWGEARAIATGRQAAPSQQARADRATQIMARTGMRYVPGFVLAGSPERSAMLVQEVREASSTLFGDGRGNTPSDQVVRRLTEQQTGVLRCVYSEPGPWSERDGAGFIAFSPAMSDFGAIAHRFQIRFWAKARPEGVDVEFLKWAERGGDTSSSARSLNLVDLAVDACPPSLGLAYATADGSEQALATARRAWSDASMEPPGPKNSLEEDQALVQSIDRTLDEVEALGKGLSPEGLLNTITTQLRPAMMRLAHSALARADELPRGPTARRQFDAWEQRWGGPLLNAIRRLYVLTARHAFRLEIEGASLQDFVINDAQRRQQREQWAASGVAGDFMKPIYAALMRRYDKHLQGQPLLDAAFVERALAMGPGAGADAPRVVAPDPAVPIRQTTIIFGTPGQIATARLLIEMGDRAGEAAEALGRMRGQIAALDLRVRTARAAFWTCHERRCAEAGPAYWRYSAALRDKDHHFLYLPTMFKALDSMSREPVVGPLHALMGAGAVDDHFIMGCEREGRAVEQHFHSIVAPHSGGNLDLLTASVKLFETGSDSDAYRRYQACRDKMEFILRFR